MPKEVSKKKGRIPRKSLNEEGMIIGRKQK